MRRLAGIVTITRTPSRNLTLQRRPQQMLEVQLSEVQRTTVLNLTNAATLKLREIAAQEATQTSACASTSTAADAPATSTG